MYEKEHKVGLAHVLKHEEGSLQHIHVLQPLNQDLRSTGSAEHTALLQAALPSSSHSLH